MATSGHENLSKITTRPADHNLGTNIFKISLHLWIFWNFQATDSILLTSHCPELYSPGKELGLVKKKIL